MRSVTALLFAVLTTLALVDDAAACDCFTPEPTVAEGRARLATVVHGRVVAARTDARTHVHQIDLLVLAAWKGATAGQTITLPVDGSSCGYFLAPGDEALIYAPAGRELQQCMGDDTARVRTGAGIAADAAALGPPDSSIAAPATTTGPAADVVAEGKVTQSARFGRRIFQLRVTKATRGATRRETLNLSTVDGPCAITAPPLGSRVEVRALRVRRELVVSGCFDSLGVKLIGRAAPRRRP